MAFGKGVDSLQLKVRGTGVTFSPPPDSVSAGGAQTVPQTVQFFLRKIETYEDFQSAFDFGASASVTYGLFHGSAKFDYAEQHNFKSFSRYLVASVIVTNAFRQIDDIQLIQPAKDLITNGQIARFQEEFGDTFVLGITDGGAYYAVLEFTCETEQDLQAISAQLDIGEYGLFTGAAHFSSRMQDFKGHTSLKIDSFQVGGTDTTQSISVDDIIAKATHFPPEVRQVAVHLTAFLQDYKTLDLPRGPNLIDVENARMVLQDYLALRNQLVQKLNEIEYIQQFPDRFVEPDLNSLAQMHSQVAQLLNQVTRGASACANKIMDCQFTPISIPAISLPSLKPGAPPIPKVPPVQMIQIPDVSGMSVVQAVQTLKLLGLVAQTQQEDISFDVYHLITHHVFHGPDQTTAILGTSPAGGAIVQPGSTVIIRVPGHVIGHPEIVIHTS
jgi:hypothetical protein